MIDFSAVHGRRGDRAADVEAVLGSVLGDRYVKSMTATRLLTRFLRMRDEIDRGEESFERKLRYLFWLN